MTDRYELEPAVRRIVAVADRLDRTDRSIPWRRRRAASAAAARTFRKLVMPDGPAMHDEHDERIDVDGGQIDVRIHRPSRGRLPVHVFLHGGGWCSGTPDERDPRCRAIAGGADCVVVSVDYRLAPENRFPTPLEDSYRALEWVVAESDRLEVDPTRISVGGESAGANLAAVLCLLARERSGPAVAFQWLDVPATDLTMQQPSVQATPKGFLLHRDDMVEYRDAYLRTVEEQTDPHASPLHAADLSGLPPAWITTCGADPLRDDGRAYVEALRAAGVAVEHQHLAGHVHPSFAFTRIASAAANERTGIRLLRAALHGGAPA
jgi:acetyl esterase